MMSETAKYGARNKRDGWTNKVCTGNDTKHITRRTQLPRPALLRRENLAEGSQDSLDGLRRGIAAHQPDAPHLVSALEQQSHNSAWNKEEKARSVSHLAGQLAQPAANLQIVLRQ